MAEVFPFPSRRRGRRRRLTKQAEVHAFPLWRRTAIVRGIAAEMQTMATVADAEDVLCQHLEIEARALDHIGVQDLEEIESLLSSFAGKAWALYYQPTDNAGAA